MLIPVSKEHIITADKLTTIRELYEFRRDGKDYNYDGTEIHEKIENIYGLKLSSKSNIFTGILFELCLFESISKSLVERIKLENQYLQQKDEKNREVYISNRLRQMRFSYELLIGRVDDGYDYMVETNRGTGYIDVKFYGTKILDNKNYANNLNLYVDRDQYERESNTNSYIQGFIIKNNNEIQIFVAGWEYKKYLEFEPDAKNPCYKKAVTQLRSINEFIDKIYEGNN